MVFLVFFVGVILATASATSPVLNETDSLVPGAKPPVVKPPVSVPRKCPENEVLKSRTSCPPDTCDTLYLSFLCVADQIPTVTCTCKDNYLRTNSTGVCVPVDRCLPAECANDPNAQRGCGNRCKKTCADYNDTKKVCKNNVCKVFGCDCKDGFVYDENIQKCVKPSQCTKQCKKPHERYSTCLLGECVPKTCNDLGKPIACPSIADPCAGGGCICEEGYVRDRNGDCIEKTKCPSCGGDPNAQSGCGNPCGKTCDSRGVNKSELFCPQYCEDNGCDCKMGFLLNTDTKKCVPEQSCPKPKQCLKPNERYSNCLLGECVPRTCDDLGKPIACAAIAGPCAGGCVCVAGFVRNSNGTCIEQTKCPSCGGDSNAQSGCGNPCGKTCGSRGVNKSELVCPQYCEVNGCDCKKGFLLDTDTKKCVPEKLCPKPPPRCGVNEQFYCGPSCPEPSCKNPNPKRCINKMCKLACFCMKGFVRNSNNKCVTADKCSSQCKGPNEVYSSCPAGQCGPKTCDNLVNPAPCPRIIPPCPGGCICREGYLRDSNGTCIEQTKCPQQCKKPNERYTNCLLGECVPKTCEDLGKPIACAAVAAPCAGGCICSEGFVRNSNGDCIEQTKCPSCGGDPNAQSGCGNPCGKTCDSRGVNKSKLFCPQYCKVNGCDCKPGFLLDTDLKICVPEKSCPKPQQCKDPNERYSTCLLGECVSKTCDDLGLPIACPAIASPCAGGCICVDGFVRNSNGTCIEKAKCPSCGGDPNAIPGCGNPCGKTCASRAPNGAQITCPLYCKADGCDCKEGFLLDTDSNKCVPEQSCPKPQPQCKGPHEVYNSCPAGQCGPKTCDNLVNPAPCPRIIPPCPGGCICREGYLRDSNGTCIEQTKCPQQCKKPNERYTNCLLGECVPKTCEDLGKPIACAAIAAPCAGGCICAEGFVRNSNGDCIEQTKCPSCGGDPNAQSGCGNPCGKTCDSRGVNKSKLFCPQYCKENGCDCKPGFLLDTDLKICVPEKSCPKPQQCKNPNERYSTCLLGECVSKTCDDLGLPIACPAIASPCAGGCICVDGFVRNSNGTCIEKAKCPSCGGDPNAIPGCGNPCGKTCASRAPNVAQIACPLYCKADGCDCKEGFLLDTDSNKCVPEQSCPKPQPQCKGPHEVYNSCPAGQCGPKTCDNLINPAPCPRVKPPCPGGCICEEGYLRDSKGICIEKNKCRQQTCSSNQTYVSCSVNCPDKYCPENDQPQPVCDPPRNCPPGCTCKINYRLNKSGQCILASECPQINCTRQNEEYNSCPSDCSSDRCEDADTPPAVCNTLLLNCQPKCVCKTNHFRNQDGLCVPAKECPSVCKDANAEWKDCKDPCPGTCENTRPGCLSKACVAGCQCKEGYVLSKPGGICVAIDTCADYVNCPANQTFVSCTFKCPQGMCPESDQTILCKPPRDCPGGCGCKPNYKYNADGVCILGSDCPSVECTRPNEEWSPCRSEYDWERCDDRFNSPPLVPDDDATCNPRCTCMKGFFKNNAYECVPEKECPPIS